MTVSRFALSLDHCRQGFAIVSAWLPAGFIPPAVFAEWAADLRAGRARSVAALALLPEADTWPRMEPLCATMWTDPRELFLQAATRKANQVRRFEGFLASRHIFAHFRTSAVQDDYSTDLHKDRHGSVLPLDAANLLLLLEERVWGCRCIETVALRA